MLRFFSNIRKKLLSESKLTRYFFYAVGEIVLIVLGILIALHLDNLNEIRKLGFIEIEILEGIHSNLDLTMEAFERTLAAERRYLSYSYKILEHLDKKKPYSDSMDVAFGTYFWTISANPVTGAYDYLKSKGIEIVTNDSLRNEISDLFEYEFTIVKEENEVWSNNLQNMISYPYHVELFRKYYPITSQPGDDEYARPNNYDALLKDEKFKNINAEIISNRRWNINSIESVIDKIVKVRSDITQEIRILKN